MRLQIPKGTAKHYPTKNVISVRANGLDWKISRLPMKGIVGTWVLADAYGEGFHYMVEGFCDTAKDSKMVSDAVKIIASIKSEP